MTRAIVPGQTVPVPFTVSETPDSLPTLTVYQSTAAGVLSDVTATTAPVVTNLAGLAYHASFTVPVDALHGSSYQLLVSVTIAGETTTHWLDGGTVELWASQASLDDVAAGVAALSAGTVSVLTPVAQIGERIELRIVRGDAYTVGSARGPVAVIVSEEGTLPDLTDATVTLTVRNRRGRHDEADPEIVFTKTGTVTTATGANQAVQFELLPADTAGKSPGRHEFDIQITPSGSTDTFTIGPSMAFYLLADQTV